MTCKRMDLCLQIIVTRKWCKRIIIVILTAIDLLEVRAILKYTNVNDSENFRRHI